jgi:thiamine biosynthesis protein ThiI
MIPPGADVLVLRYGEIGVKSPAVRSRMEERLQENIAAVLGDRDLEATSRRDQGRIYVYPEANIERVTDALTDVFGIVSVSPARRTEPTLDGIREGLAAVSRDVYHGGSFAVRARRAGDVDEHPFSSADLEREGGTAVWTAAEERGVDPTVDLETPDRTFYIECRSDQAYLFIEKRSGPGGLPLGTQDPMIALVSGGIDSPVAAWEVMSRGVPVVPLYVDLGDYGGIDHRLRAEQTANKLAAYAPNYDLRLRVAPGGPGIDRIATECESCRMLVVRRFMLRIAECLAKARGATGIVTGEAVGQKSSQTGVNLARTAEVTELPVHRPLLTLDKTDITQRAMEIGTYEQATIAAGCNHLTPKSPATKPRLEVVREAEPEGVAELATQAAQNVEILDR